MRGDLQEVYFSLPDANFPSSRAQNRDFCVRTGNFPLVFAPPEHKIGIFVRFLPSEPSFSGFLSTKSAFLCQKEQFSPGFYPFRALNRDFCSLFAFGTTIFWPFEHKIGIFVRLFYETWPLEAEKRANFFCTLLSCYCLRGTAARAPGIVAPETVAPGTVAPGTVAPETVAPWNRGTACPVTAPLPERSLVMPTLA